MDLRTKCQAYMEDLVCNQQAVLKTPLQWCVPHPSIVWKPPGHLGPYEYFLLPLCYCSKTLSVFHDSAIRTITST